MIPKYDKDTFIFGKPINTDFGMVRFLTYSEYVDNLIELSYMSMNNLHIYYQYKKQLEQTKFSLSNEEKEFLNNLKNAKLIEIVGSDEVLLSSYIKIFRLVIHECNDEKLTKVFENEENFMRIRKLVLDMQMLNEQEVVENEEIQSYIDASRELKNMDTEKQTYSDILSTIVVGTGIDYDTILKWNVLRVYATYYRISIFKNSEVTALFATVSDKVKFETWQKHVDLFEKEKTGMKMSEFNKKYGNMFN